MPIYKTDEKKDGLQKYRVRVNYTDSLGASRQLTRIAWGKDEARFLEAKLTAQLQNKEACAPSKLTVSELSEEYLKIKKAELRESSHNKLRENIKHHILPHIGTVKLMALTPNILQSWKLAIEAKSLSLATRRKAYATLNSMLKHAVRMGYIKDNPLGRIDNFKDAYYTGKPIQYYTFEEFKKYIAAAHEIALTSGKISDFDYYVFFLNAFFLGVRKGENCGLRWSDLDGNILHVQRNIVQKLKGEDRVTPPKNKSSDRFIEVPEQLLNEWKCQKQRQKDFFETFNDDFYICGGIKPLRETSVDNHNRTFATASSLKRITVHDFRHSHASVLANEGINIQEIARRLGHSKIETTWNIYSHMYPRESERALKALNALKI